MFISLLIQIMLHQKVFVQLHNNIGLFLAALGAGVMFDGDIADTRRFEKWMGVFQNYQALYIVGNIWFQAAVIDCLRDKLANIRMHAPCRSKKYSPLRRDSGYSVQ
jgi:hypothetical protein